MKKITTGSCELLAVEVQDDAYRFTLVVNKELKRRYGYFEWTGRKHGTEYWVEIPEIEKYELLGRPGEITEDVWKRIVQTVDYDLRPSPANDFQGDWATGFMDYESQYESPNSELPYVLTATASGLSLIASHNLDKERVVILKKVK